MVQFRPFINSDPPQLVAIWNAQPDSKGLTRRMKAPTLEHFVFAKPYFDRQGLIVAEQDGRLIGFAHAGFGPSEDRASLDISTGVVCEVVVLPEFESPELIGQLVGKAEEYLFAKGATKILAGPISPYNCFYHGLSGVGETAGVLDEDRMLAEVLVSLGYTLHSRNLVFRRDLTNFRAPFDRRLRVLQRAHQVHVDLEGDLGDWWELCRYGPLPRCTFQLVERSSGAVVATVGWWDQSFTGTTLQPTVSFTEFVVPEEHRRRGLGKLLVGEAMKQLRGSGAFFASTRVDSTNEVGIAFLHAFDFEQSAAGTTFCKTSQ